MLSRRGNCPPRAQRPGGAPFGAASGAAAAGAVAGAALTGSGAGTVAGGALAGADLGVGAGTAAGAAAGGASGAARGTGAAFGRSAKNFGGELRQVFDFCGGSIPARLAGISGTFSVLWVFGAGRPSGACSGATLTALS